MGGGGFSRPSLQSISVSLYGKATNNKNEIIDPDEITTLSGHNVERYGDMGLWDTVDNVGVSPAQCLIRKRPYPNL